MLTCWWQPLCHTFEILFQNVTNVTFGLSVFCKQANHPPFLYRCTSVPVCKCFSTTSIQGPKRPMTAYLRFVKQQHPLVTRQNPDLKVVEVIRKIAQQWRVLTPEQKRPFEEATRAALVQYKTEKAKYQSQLTPAQSAALKEERRQKLAKRAAIRRKRELTLLGKPKRFRSPFNIFMSEHYDEASGTTMPVYIQLSEDDRIRYKNEMKSWEEHMIEIGREDVIRGRKATSKKTVSTKAKGGKKKSTAKSGKSKATAKSKSKKSSTSSKTRKITRTVKKAEE
ncbi:hypothetical protein JZ751_007824 [Albula glossodonta]|uniref:HMG box domain-containing protein n=1 Tax=Albula glossodonta TaxID=121402 RepID=A0A8T2P0Z8_9TELE|nr:hypothetical protein JZ751_007824 [Albula glossodonta]